MHTSFEPLIATYLQNNIGISTDFLTPALCLALQARLLALHQQQLLCTGGIGQGNNLMQHDLVRTDKILWLDKANNNPHETEFFAQIDAFVQYLNATCYAGITGYEFHYALFEKGSFYRKHKDQFSNTASRQFSIISYLNPNWLLHDGGELQVHQNGTTQNIPPTQGTTVFFKSSELLHEVLETQTQRLSITGWLKRD